MTTKTVSSPLGNPNIVSPLQLSYEIALTMNSSQFKCPAQFGDRLFVYNYAYRIASWARLNTKIGESYELHLELCEE
jgi:hypothetical protein